MTAQEQSRPDVVVRRAIYQRTIADLDFKRLVFIDEMGSHRGMTRMYGRARRGERILGISMRNYGSNWTTLGALSFKKLQAVMTLEGAIDGAGFYTWVAQVLVPTLEPNQVVVMDNASIHLSKQVRACIEEAGCEMIYQPPYSPEVNAIEPAWNHFKREIRKANPQTDEALLEVISRVSLGFSLQYVTGCFAYVGLPSG